MERRVERAVLDFQHVFRRRANMLRDLVAMGGAKQQGPEDQHVQRALEQFHSIPSRFGHSVSR